MLTTESFLCNVLNGKRLVVTGGSRGLGEEIVRQAAKAGADVSFTYRSHGDVAKRLHDETGAFPYHFVLGDIDSTAGFFDSLKGRPVDYFIANAAMEFSGSLEKHTPEMITQTISTNLVGNMLVARGLITQGLMSPRGQITFVGSIAAQGNHDQFAYAASKAGLRGAVQALNLYDAQVKKQGLGIKLVEPAFVRTPMIERTLPLLERMVQRKGAGETRDKVAGEAFLEEFRREAVMDASYVATEILALTVNPKVRGVRSIPKGMDLFALRKKYL